MKKKPARQPRKIEVVEDAPSDGGTEATPQESQTSARGRNASAARATTPTPEQNATVAKPGAKKGKTKAEAKSTEPTTPPQ